MLNASFSRAARWFTVVATSTGLALLLGTSSVRAETVTPPTPNTGASDKTAPEGMVWIPGGTFSMGSTEGQTDEKPVHQVTVSGYWMDRTEVTNAQFEKFVAATGYVTVAERKPDPKDFPGAPPEALVPGAVVFTPPPTTAEVPLDNHLAWWSYAKGANWRHPNGPESDIRGRENHPVVCVCWDDAVAYAKWAGKRLPTEAEWEFAALGGAQASHAMPAKDGKWQANVWQGKFPTTDSGEDGFKGTAPVGSFPANGYGLVDMSGNVWEWCADWYRPDYYTADAMRDPQGPMDSFDPNEPGAVKRVQRGGSFLCHDCYCKGYRPSARMKCTPDTGLNHTGFRCVKPAK